VQQKWDMKSGFEIVGFGIQVSKCRLGFVGVRDVRWDKGNAEPVEDLGLFCTKGNGNYQLWLCIFLHQAVT
jgi:hypothetical protein